MRISPGRTISNRSTDSKPHASVEWYAGERGREFERPDAGVGGLGGAIFE